MATQNRSQGGARGRQRKGAFWIELDVSSLQERLAGISAGNLMSRSEFRRMSVHYGLKAKEVAVRATRSAVRIDPREAWRGVSLGYADKLGHPVLYLGINETRTADRRAWNPKRKGTRGRRSISSGTRRMNEYWGRSRAMVLRWLNGGTQQRITNYRGRYNRTTRSYIYKMIDKGRGTRPANRGSVRGKNFFYGPARRALVMVSEGWLNATSEMIARTFNR